MHKNTAILLLSILLVSFASIFPKVIELNAGVIIWWRCLFAFIFLGIILWRKNQLEVPRIKLVPLAFSGVLLGVHWWTFFLSIQISSVSIGVLTLFTYPLITAVIEPFTSQVALAFRQIIGGFGIVAGVYFLVPEFSLSNTLALGTFIGLFSALLYAGRNILTVSYLSNINAMTILCYQLVFAFLAVSIALLFTSTTIQIPTPKDSFLLAVLIIVFTIGAHGLLTYSLKLFSTSTVGIVSSLQVVSSNVLAYLLLSEVPDKRFYLGGIIIVSIAIYELLPRKFNAALKYKGSSTIQPLRSHRVQNALGI